MILAEKVFVRIRPEESDVTYPSPNSHNTYGTLRSSLSSSITSLRSEPPKCITLIDDKTIRLIAPEKDGPHGGSRKSVSAVDDKLYSFDKIFPEEAAQEDIYKSVSSMVKATVRGYNTTIFAYGCTGSGKSFTMTGNGAAPGVIPRAISEIFTIIEETAASESDVFFYVRISYVELYNNNFRNLLEFAAKELAAKEKDNSSLGLKDSSESSYYDNATTFPSKHNHNSGNTPGNSSRNEKIEVRESQSAGVFLAGPYLRIPVTTAKEAFQLIAKGNKFRAVGATQCNDFSSRYNK